MPVLTLDEVEATSLRALMRAGASEGQAAPVARSIRAAEAEGIRGIGLGYLPWYCNHLKVGKIVADAVPVVTQPRPGTVAVDAGGGFAHPAYEAGEAALIATARAQGIAALGVSGAYACGVVGYFTDRLARAGLVALATSNASSSMAAWGGARPFFGTNPWSFAAPRDGHPPLVIDAAATATTKISIIDAAAAGTPLPEGWALDALGRPTTDAAEGLRGSVAPAGGHKGSALALMIEVLSAGLTGAVWSHAASSLGDDAGGPPRLGQFFLAMDPDLFGAGGFGPRLDDMLGAMIAEPGVRLPGDRRHAHRAVAERGGVSVDAALLAGLA